MSWTRQMIESVGLIQRAAIAAASQTELGPVCDGHFERAGRCIEALAYLARRLRRGTGPPPRTGSSDRAAHE